MVDPSSQPLLSEENSLVPQPIETLQLRCEWIEEPSFAEPWAELDFSDDSISCIAISLREKPPKAIGFAFPDMPGISLQRKLEPSDPESRRRQTKVEQHPRRTVVVPSKIRSRGKNLR